MTRPVKPFTTVLQQAALLRSHGMKLDDEHARQWLTAVGYYRLSGYWYVYRDFNADGVTRSDDFVPRTCLADVVALYEFDRKLGTLVHDGIERIEVAVRAALAAHLGARSAEYPPGHDRQPGCADISIMYDGMLPWLNGRSHKTSASTLMTRCSAGTRGPSRGRVRRWLAGCSS